jgi:hypothetical protein
MVFRNIPSATAFITELLAMTDTPDDALVEGGGDRAVRHMLTSRRCWTALP